MSIRFTGLAFVACLTLSSVALAEKAAKITPIQSKPAQQILDEQFTGSKLGPKWSIAKGSWEVVSGTLVGKEKAADKHAAVLSYNHPNRDSVIQFSFKLDGAKTFNLSFNHAKGHLFRVLLAPNGLEISKDKDKSDPKSKAESLGKAPTKFEAGKWYTLLVEIEGDKVTAQTDNGIKVHGSHVGLNVEKTGYRFVTAGESVTLSDIKIWELAK